MCWYLSQPCRHFLAFNHDTDAVLKTRRRVPFYFNFSSPNGISGLPGQLNQMHISQPTSNAGFNPAYNVAHAPPPESMMGQKGLKFTITKHKI